MDNNLVQLASVGDAKAEGETMDTEERPGFLKLEKLSPAAEQVAKSDSAISSSTRAERRSPCSDKAVPATRSARPRSSRLPTAANSEAASRAASIQRTCIDTAAMPARHSMSTTTRMATPNAASTVAAPASTARPWC